MKIRGRHYLLLPVLILFVGLVAWERTDTTCMKRHTCNIILVAVDTLAAEHLGIYGYSRDTSPFIDEFFGDGVVFKDVSSTASWTLPSFGSLWFSRLPSEIKVSDFADRDVPSLPELFRKNEMPVHASLFTGDFFINESIGKIFNEEEITRSYSSEVLRNAATQIPRLTKEREESEKPFFLFAHTFLVHDPYDPEPPASDFFFDTETFPVVERDYEAEFAPPYLQYPRTKDPDERSEYAFFFKLRYDQEIRELDLLFEEFIRSIPEDVLDDTIVILTSDHGEAFDQHDVFWHANNIYQEEVRVPLLVRTPKKAGLEYTHPRSLMDIAPTLLEHLALPTPNEFDGESFYPVLSDGMLDLERNSPVRMEHGSPGFASASTTYDAFVSDYPDRIIFEEDALTHRAVRDASWKLIQHDDAYELYNLENDPYEKHNRIHDDVDAVLERLLPLLTSGR